VAYLENRTVLATGDLDEVREFVSGLTGRHKLDVRGGKADLSAKLAVGAFGDLSLLHFGFGNAEVGVTSGDEGEDGLLVYVVTEGMGSFRSGGTEGEFSVARGVVRDLALPITAVEDNLSSFSLPLSKARLRRHAGVLTGVDVGKTPVQFDQSIDMTAPAGRLFRNTLQYVAASLDGPLRELDSPILARQMEEFVLTQVLTLLPNSLSDAMADCAQRVALPYHVKRVRDHIHAHAHEAIGVADLAAASGCGYRTVQNAFKEIYRMSPMAYLRFVRLNRVRSALLDGGDDMETIAHVARMWGFSHMGRFSEIYRRQFGELPSATMRKRP
jgi:AraC-like DNA-binding protein